MCGVMVAGLAVPSMLHESAPGMESCLYLSVCSGVVMENYFFFVLFALTGPHTFSFKPSGSKFAVNWWQPTARVNKWFQLNGLP